MKAREPEFPNESDGESEQVVEVCTPLLQNRAEIVFETVVAEAEPRDLIPVHLKGGQFMPPKSLGESLDGHAAEFRARHVGQADYLRVVLRDPSCDILVVHGGEGGRLLQGAGYSRPPA